MREIRPRRTFSVCGDGRGLARYQRTRPRKSSACFADLTCDDVGQLVKAPNGEAPDSMTTLHFVPPPGKPGRSVRRPDGLPGSVAPFAQLPTAILEDHRLTGAGVRILAALAYYGWRTGRCFPGLDTIAGKAGVHRRTVMRLLPTLVELGFIRMDPDAGNPTGRVFTLAWRHPEGQGAESPGTPLRGASCPPELGGHPVPDALGGQPAPRMRNRCREQSSLKTSGGERPVSTTTTPANPTATLPTGRAKPEGSPPRLTSRRVDRLRAARLAIETAALASGDPLLLAFLAERSRATPPPPPERPASTAELLRRVTEDPSWALHAAEALSREFRDHKSFRGFESVIRRACDGRLSTDDLVEAYRQACGPQARNRGAVFMFAARGVKP